MTLEGSVTVACQYSIWFCLFIRCKGHATMLKRSRAVEIGATLQQSQVRRHISLPSLSKRISKKFQDTF